MAQATKAKKGQEYRNLMFKPAHLTSNRIMIGVPMTGLIRSEWALARFGQVIPCNWSDSHCIQWLNQATPLGYSVAEARNILVHEAVTKKFEWLLFIDHDVILPSDCFVRLNEYMRKGDIPVVAGLYFAKSHPPEPLIYRGRGNSFYSHWKFGDKVWVDGIPMGCTLINCAVLKLMYDDAPEIIVGGNRKVKEVFDTPFGVNQDPEQGVNTYQGTEDLAWCNRVMAGNYLKKAGWDKIARKRYPFLVDTGIYCKHITNDGQVYPLELNGMYSRNGK